MTGLPEVQEALVRLLEALPERPHRVRLSAGEITLELDWPGAPAANGVSGVPIGPAVPAHPVTAGTAAAAAAGGGAAPDGPDTAGGAEPPALHHVCSPSVGTFYQAPEPGAAPFVKEGDTVRPGQQIAIVEAMKLMLPVDADRAGRVTAVLKSDGESVEYGEPLVSLTTEEA